MSLDCSELESGAQASRGLEHIDLDLLFRDLQDWELTLKAEPAFVHKLLAFEEEAAKSGNGDGDSVPKEEHGSVPFQSVRGPKP